MTTNLLKYRVRDKQNKPTNTWMPVTPEVIRSPVRYSEVVKIRRALAYNMRREGFTCKDIGAILNQHESTIEYGLTKVDYNYIEVVKSIKL